MVRADDIGWGRYGTYEGPFFRGVLPFDGTRVPTFEDKVVAVITATEGGHYDAINMYDRCIVSVGLIQFCESGSFGVSTMLGAARERGAKLDALGDALAQSQASFGRNADGRWRFALSGGREVGDETEQRRLFLLRSSGKAGSWDAESRAHAKLWAACLANVWAEPAAREAQLELTRRRVLSYAMPSAKAVLFQDPRPSESIVGAVRAAFLSFAANLPKTAADQLGIAQELSSGPKWSDPWVETLMRQLTFGPRIAIYPARYRAIRPVVERLFGVALPDLAEEFERWRAEHASDDAGSVVEVQRILVELGYEIGTADGIFGNRTRDAVKRFQREQGLEADGIVGPRTWAALQGARARRASATAPGTAPVTAAVSAFSAAPVTAAPAPAPALSSGASMFLELLPEWPGPARDAAILEAVRSGLHDPIRWAEILTETAAHKGTIAVSEDALTIGGVRINVSHTLAQQLADILGASLPTSKIADLIHEQAAVKIKPCIQPQPAPPGAPAMHSKAAMLRHSREVDAKIAGAEGLRSTVGKDWILDNALRGKPNLGVNYGWHSTEAPYFGPRGAKVWQPVGTRHDRHHVDYSQVLRLVRPRVTVDAAEHDLFEVMRSPELAALVSYGGVLHVTRHPGVVPELAAAMPAELAPAGPAAATPAPPTLRRGMQGEQVAAWQRIIEATADGIFGPATEALTKAWQSRHGLKADGIVDAETWAAALAAVPPVLPAAGDFAAAVLAAAQRDVFDEATGAGVRETSPNSGPRVDEMLRAVHVEPPANWCAAAVTSWLRAAELATGLPSPIAGSAGAKALMAQLQAKSRWWPKHELAGRSIAPGMIVVWHRGDPGAWTGHIGVVERVHPDHLETIEGNSGPKADRVARMKRSLGDALLLGVGWVSA